MKLLKPVILLACVISLVSCLGNTGSEPTVITEPLGRSYYYITNQSESNLNVTYKIANFAVDSTVAVPTNSTTKVFQLARSNFPAPSEAFDNLRFFMQSSDMTSPIFVVEPIVDENWNDITAEGDTVKKYELRLTEEDIE
ncbi:hypothetical protein SAMN05443144_11362 [Fodinibius roseus]|uniref:Uncharacterized protein n=1 Tax=Fodinibius roseus TaxID=1194090 RepID=A0A1M5EHI3_9BACT|nr:hypothetical protein [Fodinibius roseus]SHF78705.1 hypothetical protein SAMN05443144_11362 [Fodinibius roseus]